MHPCRLAQSRRHEKILKVCGKLRLRVPLSLTMGTKPARLAGRIPSGRHVSINISWCPVDSSQHEWSLKNVDQRKSPCGWPRGRFGRYLLTVRSEIRMPNLSNSSLAIRSSPHRGSPAPSCRSARAGLVGSAVDPVGTSVARTTASPRDASEAKSPAARPPRRRATRTASSTRPS
jgi:hypothetical protein